MVPLITLQINLDVFKVNLESLADHLSWNGMAKGYFSMEAGENHHKLLSHLVQQLPSGSKVTDLGTLYGSSAISMSTNPNVQVFSYDIINQIPGRYEELKNIKFIEKDATTCVNEYIDSSIILLDIGPHDGIQEKIILDKLQNRNYKGILICDDIYLSQAMEDFWHGIRLKKYDVTKYGHWSGTGLIIFDPLFINVLVDN